MQPTKDADTNLENQSTIGEDLFKPKAFLTTTRESCVPLDYDCRCEHNHALLLYQMLVNPSVVISRHAI